MEETTPPAVMVKPVLGNLCLHPRRRLVGVPVPDGFADMLVPCLPGAPVERDAAFVDACVESPVGRVVAGFADSVGDPQRTDVVPVGCSGGWCCEREYECCCECGTCQITAPS